MSRSNDLLACIEELVGQENWDTWEESMRMLFRATKVLDVVEGTIKEPVITKKSTPDQIERAAAYDVSGTLLER